MSTQARQITQPSLARRAATPVLGRAAGLALFLLVWAAVTLSGLVPSLILPTPVEVYQAALLHWRELLEALGTTLYEIAVATVLSWACGIAVGLAIALTPLRRLVTPMLEGAFAIPWVVVYPLMVAWTGIGSVSKILFGFIFGFFPVVLGTIAAVRSIDPMLNVLARSLAPERAWWRVALKIHARAALPGVLSGMRIAAGLVLISVTVGELLSSTGGIGFLIATYQGRFDSGAVYLGIFTVIVLAWLTNRLLSSVEHRWGYTP